MLIANSCFVQVLSYVGELDPDVLQPSFSEMDLQIGVSGADDKWYVGILGKNLTDEKTTTYHRNDVLNTGTYYALTEPPRALYLIGLAPQAQEGRYPSAGNSSCSSKASASPEMMFAAPCRHSINDGCGMIAFNR